MHRCTDTDTHTKTLLNRKDRFEIGPRVCVHLSSFVFILPVSLSVSGGQTQQTSPGVTFSGGALSKLLAFFFFFKQLRLTECVTYMHILTWRNAQNHTRSGVLAGSWEGDEAAAGLTFPSRYQTALFFSPDFPSGHVLSTFHWLLQSKGAVINNMRTLSLSLIWAILKHIKNK